MSEALKKAFRNKCGEAGKHLGPFDSEDGEDGEEARCYGCSTAHVDEFGDCVGVVIGLTDYNNKGEVRDEDKVGPEVDVRWEPDNLRYAYHPDFLDYACQGSMPLFEEAFNAGDEVKMEEIGAKFSEWNCTACNKPITTRTLFYIRNAHAPLKHATCF